MSREPLIFEDSEQPVAHRSDLGQKKFWRRRLLFPTILMGRIHFPKLQDRYWVLGMFLRGSHVNKNNNELTAIAEILSLSEQRFEMFKRNTL